MFPEKYVREVLLGRGNIEIETGIRADNSSVVAHPINSVTKERRSRGLIGRNSEELKMNPRLSLPHIMGPLNMPNEIAKTTTREKLISLLARDIPKSISGQDKNALRDTHPSGQQYLAFRGTNAGRRYFDAFARRISVVGS